MELVEVSNRRGELVAYFRVSEKGKGPLYCVPWKELLEFCEQISQENLAILNKEGDELIARIFGDKL